MEDLEIFAGIINRCLDDEFLINKELQVPEIESVHEKVCPLTLR